MASLKRITKELAECQENPPAGCSISYAESNVHQWTATMTGPEGTPYAGGVFTVAIKLPTDYPFKAPTVSFTTRVYHPNVTNDATGAICLGLLKPENWKPASRVRTVLEAVRRLLAEPNPDDALESRIADEYKTDRRAFDENVRTYVARYAKPDAASEKK
jgi:ubiquitin-protein ligase